MRQPWVTQPASSATMPVGSAKLSSFMIFQYNEKMRLANLFLQTHEFGVKSYCPQGHDFCHKIPPTLFIDGETPLPINPSTLPVK
jgi:hypothetical protein